MCLVPRRILKYTWIQNLHSFLVTNPNKIDAIDKERCIRSMFLDTLGMILMTQWLRLTLNLTSSDKFAVGAGLKLRYQNLKSQWRPLFSAKWLSLLAKLFKIKTQLKVTSQLMHRMCGSVRYFVASDLVPVVIGSLCLIFVVAHRPLAAIGGLNLMTALGWDFETGSLDCRSQACTEVHNKSKPKTQNHRLSRALRHQFHLPSRSLPRGVLRPGQVLRLVNGRGQVIVGWALLDDVSG